MVVRAKELKIDHSNIVADVKELRRDYLQGKDDLVARISVLEVDQDAQKKWFNEKLRKVLLEARMRIFLDLDHKRRSNTPHICLTTHSKQISLICAA